MTENEYNKQVKEHNTNCPLWNEGVDCGCPINLVDKSEVVTKEDYKPSDDTNLEYCVFDMQCYNCGMEIDYRNSDGNDCDCICHELV